MLSTDSEHPWRALKRRFQRLISGSPEDPEDEQEQQRSGHTSGNNLSDGRAKATTTKPPTKSDSPLSQWQGSFPPPPPHRKGDSDPSRGATSPYYPPPPYNVPFPYYNPYGVGYGGPPCCPPYFYPGPPPNSCRCDPCDDEDGCSCGCFLLLVFIFVLILWVLLNNETTIAETIANGLSSLFGWITSFL